MTRNRMQTALVIVTAFYLFSLIAPVLALWSGIDLPEALDDIISPGENPDGWDELNPVQQRSLVDWSRNTSSQNYRIVTTGGDSHEYAGEIAADSSGNVYLIGSFYSGAKIGETMLTGAGNSDIFIAKMDNSGEWSWAISAGGVNDDVPSSISVDANDDVIITGHFNGSDCSSWDSWGYTCTGAPVASFGNHNLTSTGNSDVFVAKLSSSGAWSWVVTAGGTSGDIGRGIATDSSGNSLLTGYFQGTTTFGSTSLTSSGNYDVFVAKLSSSGSWSWAVKAGGTSADYAEGIATDSSGNSYLTGDFQGTATFGSTSLISSGGSDVFVAKLSSSGAWSWAVRAGGTSGDIGKGIALDSSGNSYLTGRFYNTATFGSTNLTSSGGYDIFVAKLSSSGSWSWVTKAGSSSYYDYGEKIAVDSNGKAYITGKFKDTATFGSNSISSSGTYDVFIAATNSEGSWIWSKKAGGNSGESGTGIAIDSVGSVHVAGKFSGSFSFISDTFQSSDDSDDIFVISLPADSLEAGFAISQEFGTAGGTGADIAFAVATDSVGNAYVTGSFEDTVSFGSTTLESSGNEDVFVAKVSTNGDWIWAISGGGTADDRGYGIKVDSNDLVFVTGVFGSTGADFDTISLSSSGFQDIFVAYVTTDWEDVIRGGGSKWDWAYDIELDASSNVYILGSFQNPSTTIGGTTLTSAGGYDSYVAKASFDGADLSWDWAVRGGASANELIGSIVIDPSSSHIYITGGFAGTGATYGASGSTCSLSSSNSYDIYVVNLSTSDGACSWAEMVSGSGHQVGHDIILDSNGDILITGEFENTVSFGSTSLTSSGRDDIFVGKMTSSGAWSWAVRAGGTENDNAKGLSLDSKGDLYVTGFFEDWATFGSTNLTSSGLDNMDIFVAKLSHDASTGGFSWSSSISLGGGEDSDSGYDIAATSSGTVVVGTFKSTASFGPSSVTSEGSTDIFVARTSVDSDSDSYADEDDEFLIEPTQQTDSDSDGFGDNRNGYHGDSCASIYGVSWQDRWGCPDMDGDGQSDLYDAFMQKSSQWNDTDGDGRGDNWDGTIVDRNGSTDGIGEYWNNAYLPDPYPLDYDNDGFNDSTLQPKGAGGPFDNCPFIYGLSREDRSGCVDSDGDGWSDFGDSHPGDGTQHADFDNDGYGDDMQGNLPDFCPTVFGNSTADRYGCTDNDGDGYSNWTDVDDSDGLEWNDADHDGYGDNGDACPYSWGNVTVGPDRGCMDRDGDGYADQSDDLPFDATQWQDQDGDGFGDAPGGNEPDACISEAGASRYGVVASENVTLYGCPDGDFDGYWNNHDLCPFSYGNSWVDRFACPDSDQDGISDVNDPLPQEATSDIDDYDGDGYPDHAVSGNNDSFPLDATQWNDQDSDGWGDNPNGNMADAFPTVQNQWSDYDGDGYGDNPSGFQKDGCPTTDGNSTIDRFGCTDTDGDGFSDASPGWFAHPAGQADSHPEDVSQARDKDGDGFGDSKNGTEPDACVNDAGTSTMRIINGQNVTALGCFDSDGDGYEDDSDPCRFQFGNSWVDRLGCPDADEDGISDAMDPYPNTRATAIDDWDGDGVPNNSDDFPGDVSQWSDTDEDGYGDNSAGQSPDAFPDDDTQWQDSDGDGFGDEEDGETPDGCVYEAGNSTDPEYGCIDTDGDGRSDEYDDFPRDAAQQDDSDGDGYGDDGEGNTTDDCPNEWGDSTLGEIGCPDSDGDGWSDEFDECEDQAGNSAEPYTGCLDRDGDGIADVVDEFPDNANESADADGDGIGDAADLYPNDYDNDGTPTELDWDDEDADEQNDRDDDGVGDNADDWPDNPDLWSDADGDGYADQAGYDLSDNCPSTPGTSTRFQLGCSDIDEDGMPDVLDPDIDGDGVTNDNELDASDEAAGVYYDPFNYSSTPPDMDGDMIPDVLDFDKDGDGFPNTFEEERGSSSDDADSTPFTQYGEQNTGMYYIPGEGFQSEYTPEGKELSVSMLVDLLTSEYLAAILMVPLTLFALMRKKRRYKKVRRRLEVIDELDDLQGAEAEIDRLILKGKVKVEHGVLLRNLYERRRDALSDNSSDSSPEPAAVAAVDRDGERGPGGGRGDGGDRRGGRGGDGNSSGGHGDGGNQDGRPRSKERAPERGGRGRDSDNSRPRTGGDGRGSRGGDPRGDSHGGDRDNGRGGGRGGPGGGRGRAGGVIKAGEASGGRRSGGRLPGGRDRLPEANTFLHEDDY
jgi:hypothetical protein